jgi:hypothetical protein
MHHTTNIIESHIFQVNIQPRYEKIPCTEVTKSKGKKKKLIMFNKLLL